ncbi:hypothetical protein VPHD239_0108 [Vibrio phage D239]
MPIPQIVALEQGNPANTSGTGLATSINQTIDLSESTFSRLQDLGALVGTHIPDNSTLEEALEALDAAIPTDTLAWLLSTDTFSRPIIAYQALTMDINSSGTISPLVIGGTLPFTEFEVSGGSLPSEVSLDTVTGVLSYTTTAALSTGSFDIVAKNPVGTSDAYTVNYSISAPQGVSEFTNSLNIYPAVRITTSNSLDEQPLVKSSFFGTVNGSGVISTDSTFPIYTASNGDGTYNYFINRDDSTYWYFYRNSVTDPSTLAGALVTDLTTSLSYDLVSPNTNDVIVDGVKYPSDQTDVHWISAFNHFNVEADASLNGFMSRDNDWSFGFRLQDDVPLDGLGRILFSRRGRNWLGFYLGHNGTYTNMIYGNGSSRNYSGDVSFPSGGFTTGQFVRVTYDFSANTASIYVDGTKYFESTFFGPYFDYASSSDPLELDFGWGEGSNGIPTSSSYYRALWQGELDRMWITVGSVEASDDDGTTFPDSATHAWLLDEATGSTFAPSIGSQNMVGLVLGE